MKTFLSTLTGVIVVIILGLVVVGFIFLSRVPDMISNHLAGQLKVSVEIDDMHFGLSNIGIDKVVIGNPPGCVLSEAFSCKTIQINAPVTRYFNQNVVIEEINIDGVYLGLEFDSATTTNGNWTRIMQNVEDSSAKEAQRNPKPSSPGSARTVLIRRLVLTNIDVDVVYRKEGGRVKKLPTIDRIELTDISSEGGLPMDQIMNSVLGEMLKSVFLKQNLKNMLQDLLNPQSDLNKIIKPFRGFFNANPDPKPTNQDLAAS